MFLKSMSSVAALALLGMVSLGSQAATVSLMPVGSPNILLGDTITLEIWADFSDTPTTGVVGGSLDITYDTGILSYNNDFAFDAGFGADPGISFTGDDCSGGLIFDCTKLNEINFISPNAFNDMAETNTLMGTLSFDAVGLGTDVISMATGIDLWAWADATNFGNIEPTYNPATVNVSAIPVPAAVWLMATGLGMLGGFVRRRRHA